MNGGTNSVPGSGRKNGATVGSNGRSRISPISAKDCTSCGLGHVRGHFSCRRHVGSSSTWGYGIGPSSFSSSSRGGAFSGGGYGRSMSTGSCPSGSYGGHLRFGNGLVRIGSGDVGNAIGGVGAAPAVCGIIFSSTDEKVVMQNLNDRLASYIDKVRCLEAGNAELESKISDFYAKQGPPGERKDYSHYYRQMEELKNQIISTTVEINKILLKIDNNQLDVEDMRQKLECECSIRQNVEADLNGLHLILTQLTSSVTDLEAKRESLEEELCHLKKTHAEEVNRLQKWTSDVTVQVSTTPGPDLKRLLEEMRHKYEAMINSNRKEVVQWYESKLEEVNQKVYTRSKEAEDGRRKVVDLRRQLQAFEIDLQTQCNLKDSLQVSLAEIEHCYNTQLAEIQDHISCMEQQLTELRLEMEDQDQDYKELLDVKTRLEQEIQTYRSLLEGGQPDHVGGGARRPPSAGRVGGIGGHPTQ